MKVMVCGALLALAAGGASAQTPVTSKALMATPASFNGKTIVVRNLPCVDDPKHSFLCLEQQGGKTLRIEAFALGAKTSLSIAQTMISTCKGLQGLAKPECRFDAEISPTTALATEVETPTGEVPGVFVVSPGIELKRAKR